MNIEKVVENIQRVCKQRGTNPTEAGRESGAGKDLVTNMRRRGILPSIEKMSMLATYLGVTTSELLGEEKEPTPFSEGGPGETAKRFMPFVDQLTSDQQRLLLAQLQAWTEQNERPSPAAPAASEERAPEFDP